MNTVSSLRFILILKSTGKIIPTSPQWKGLVLPVVQLYTMMFLGLQRQRWKQWNIKRGHFSNLNIYLSRKTWDWRVPFLHWVFFKIIPKGLIFMFEWLSTTTHPSSLHYQKNFFLIFLLVLAVPYFKCRKNSVNLTSSFLIFTDSGWKKLWLNSLLSKPI